jgi:hypothetical protein
MMVSPTQAALDGLAAMKLDPHVPKRPTPDAEKVRYCKDRRMYIAWLVAEDESSGEATIVYHDDCLGIDKQIAVASRRVLR